MANLPPPQLSGVIYNENANRISVNWQPSDGQFYMIALFEQEKMLDAQRVIGFSGELIPRSKLEPHLLYQVKVAQTDSPGGYPGPFSPPADVITEQLLHLQVRNGSDSFSVQWELPKLGNVNGARVIVLDEDSGRPIYSEQMAGSGGSIATAGLWKPDTSYSLIVYPTRGISQGPASSPLPIVQKVPTCTLMGYERSPDGKQSMVQAGSNPPLPADMWVELTVYRGDNVLASNRSPSTSIAVQFDHVLNPSYHYTGTLRYRLGNSAGPESPREPVLVASPIIEQVEVKEAEAHVTWRHLPIAPQPIYGQVAVVQGETPVAQATVLGNKAKLTLPDKLDPKALYEVRVNGIWGISRGPMSGKVPLLADEPRAASVAYNGRTLLVAWHEEAGAGVTDYQVQVWQEGILASSAVCQAQAQRAALAVQLDPASSYQVTLCPYAAHTWGKPGPAVAIIAAVPGVSSILTDASSIQAQIEEPTIQAGITGYRGHLYEGDKLLTTVEATQAAKGPAVIFPRKVEGDAGYEVREGFNYTVRLQAVGEQAKAASGPLSKPYPVIASEPRMTALIYDRVASQVLVRWEASREASVSGYVVDVTDGEQQTVVQTAGCEAVVKLEPGKGGIVRVSARNAWARGPACAGIAVLTESVAMTKAMYADGWLHAAWQASQHNGQTSYRIEVLTGGGEVVHAAESSMTEAWLNVALQQTGDYSVRVTVLDGESAGAPGNPLSILTAVPGASSIVTDQKYISISVEEPSRKSGIAGYRGYLYEGDKLLAEAASVQTADGPVVLFPCEGEDGINYEVKEGFAYAVRLRAVGEQPQGLSGPFSTTYPIIVSVPRVTVAAMNGYSWRLGWTDSLEAAVQGYVVTVVDQSGGDPLTFYTTDTHYQSDEALPMQSPIAQVQAVGEVSRGPLSQPIRLYGEGASYYVSRGESSQPAYLYRSYERTSSAAGIRLYVPNVFLAEPQSGSDVFVWTKADDAPANYSYKLTVAETGPAWKFDAQSRSELWEAYLLLVKQLDEALVRDEGEAAAGGRLLKPGVFHTLRQAIARSLPLLFTEQLQYAYGFNQENSYIDLVPGMRLRLEAATRQFVGAPSPITEHLNGFVPSGTLWLTIGEYWRADSIYTGFDAFLSLCERPSVPSPQAAGGAGGTLDLYSDNGGRRRLYRLLYPMNYPESSGMGHADRTDQILLLGADSYAQLEEATAQYVNGGNFDGYEDKIIVYTFRGRAVLVPEIPIEINSETCYVPVGTTLRDIAARFGGAPYPASQFLSQWKLERCTVNVVGTAAEARAAVQIPSYTEVRLSDSPMQTYRDDRSCFDLPLLHGDRIRLGQSGRGPAGGNCT